MSRNEDFDNGLWSHPVFEELSDAAAWLYIWSWTNPRCDMAGIYTVGRRAMTESRVKLDAIDEALAELASVQFVYYERGILWVRDRVARLRSKQERMAIGVARDFVRQVPGDHPFHRRWLDLYGDHAWLRAAIRDALRTFQGTSREVPVMPDEHGDSENLIGHSHEVLKEGSRSESGSAPSRGRGGSSRTRRKTDPLIPPRELAARHPGVATRLDEVLGVLCALHDELGGSIPTPRSVGLKLLRYPDRDHIGVAHDLREWLLVGNGQNVTVNDVTDWYGTFLRRAARVAPSARRVAGAAGVDDLIEQMRRRGEQQADDIIEGSEAAA